MLLKEHRFTFLAGVEMHVITIDELIGGLVFWPKRFRAKLPASAHAAAKTIYGADCDEVARAAAEVMAGPAAWEVRAQAQCLAQTQPDATPQMHVQE